MKIQRLLYGLKPLTKLSNQSADFVIIFLTQDTSRNGHRSTAMNRDEYREDMTDYIERVLEPIECLSRIFVFGNEGQTSQPQSEHNDIGNVTYALASLAKIQLRDFASQLAKRYGDVNLVLPRGEYIPTKIVDILPKNKE